MHSIELEDAAHRARIECLEAREMFHERAALTVGLVVIVALMVWTYGLTWLVFALTPLTMAVFTWRAFLAMNAATLAMYETRARFDRFKAEQREDIINQQKIAAYFDRRASNDGVPPEAAE